MNPQLPALIDDFKLLAKVTDTYADVVPQIADTLRNTVKTGNTLVSAGEAQRVPRRHRRPSPTPPPSS